MHRRQRNPNYTPGGVGTRRVWHGAVTATLSVLALASAVRTLAAQDEADAIDETTTVDEAALSRSDVIIAADASQATQVFQRFSDRVIKIRVLERGSAAKSGIGTGFFVSAEGHVVSNFHVIAAVVYEPERYRAELVQPNGSVEPLSLLGFDVVHDLAVLRSDAPPADHFELRAVSIGQGDRLFSLGHPRDLALSIVEGTYNGHLPHTLYPKIHFTGAINPGMSGGPTLNTEGEVVGVNVSTAGNGLSFLVPVDRAVSLFEKVSAQSYRVPEALPAAVAEQITAYQDVYLRDLFDDTSKQVQLGPFRVATEPAPYFRCWGDTQQSGEQRYETVYHYCSTDDNVHLARDHRAGMVEISHMYLTSTVLNRFQFHTKYGEIFAADNTPAGAEKRVTSWRCTAKNVRHGKTSLRTVLCLRRYKKLGSLYDAVLKVAVLGEPTSGLVSTLTLSGVTYENVQAVSRRYLERITWR